MYELELIVVVSHLQMVVVPKINLSICHVKDESA